MRTKALLSMAALAAGALTSMAQSNVYSLNVVGYVNTPLTASMLVAVAPPLDPGTNDLTGLIPTAPLGASVLTWNVGLQDFDSTIPSYSTKKAAWVPDPIIPPGNGFFLSFPVNGTNTWVGNVRQGSLVTAIHGGALLDLIGSQVPIGGSLTTNALAGYPGTLGDSVLTWNVSLQDFDASIASYSTKKSAFVPDPTLNVGDAFFLARQGTAISYTRNFTVQ